MKPIEEHFSKLFKTIHKDIDASVFFNQHAKYTEAYSSFLMDDLVNIHKEINKHCPYINSSLKARIKSPTSYIMKSFLTLAKNIDTAFSSPPSDLDKLKKREDDLYTYFKFIAEENPERFENLKNKIYFLSQQFTPEEVFTIIFDQLNDEEKNTLVYRLGRTEDTFAIRCIVDSIDFPIENCYVEDDGTIGIIDKTGTKLPFRLPIKLDPKQDILQDEKTGDNYIIVNGKKEILSEHNLLYSPDLPRQDRCLANAKKDEDGKITLLGDSLVSSQSGEPIDIASAYYDKNFHSIFITDMNGETKNLNKLLQKQDDLCLRKYDDASITPFIYQTQNIVSEYFKNNDIILIEKKLKDYISNPKASNYQSLHLSAVHKLLNYVVEMQIRSRGMDDQTQKKDTPRDHDEYKREKAQKQNKNPLIGRITKKIPDAFDSSSSSLKKLLEKGVAELTDVLPTYFLVTKGPENQTFDYIAPLNVSFNHMFKGSMPPKSSLDLDFSNYTNYIASKERIEKSKNKYLGFAYDD